MEGKESYTDVLIRLDQRLKDFILENQKEHAGINTSLKELSQNCNHVHDGLVQRIVDVETKQSNCEAIKKDRIEKQGFFQGKLREYSIMIGLVTVPTSLIVTIIVNWNHIVSFIH